MGAGGIIIFLHHEQNIFKIAQHRASLPIIEQLFNWSYCNFRNSSIFWILSKDAILAAAFQEGQYLIWAIAMFTAF